MRITKRSRTVHERWNYHDFYCQCSRCSYPTDRQFVGTMMLLAAVIGGLLWMWINSFHN